MDAGGLEAAGVGEGEEVAGDADGLVELLPVLGGFAADELEDLLAVDQVVACGAAEVFAAALERGANEVGGQEAVARGEVVRLDVVGAQAHVEGEVEGGDGLLIEGGLGEGVPGGLGRGVGGGRGDGRGCWAGGLGVLQEWEAEEEGQEECVTVHEHGV